METGKRQIVRMAGDVVAFASLAMWPIGRGRPSDGLYVLDSIGKFNMHRFMNLLTCLGVSHAVMYDNDNNKEEHADVNQLIEDSKSSLTYKLVAIAGDLEQLLSIPKPISDHRKPQHLLYLYENGKIAHKNLQGFCATVQACLPRAAKI